LELPVEKWTGSIAEIKIGATKDEGGTRGKTFTIGGQKALNHIKFDGAYPNLPVIAMEVYDNEPDYPASVKEALGDVFGKPVEWAKKAVGEWGADIVCLKLAGTNPEEENTSAEDAAKTVEDVLKAIPNPIMVYGSGSEEKDTQVMQAVGEIMKAENCIIGLADEEKYKSMCVAAMGFNQILVGFSNLDINLAKQLNILLTEFGVKKDRIIMDPLMAGLGYGLDYSYSVIERIRLAALMGDSMLQCPIVADTALAWNAREATTDEASMGDAKMRGEVWEATTGFGAAVAGADLLIMRHPGALKYVKNAVNDLGGGQ
jgi:acetyl-CoA decarbonylase/synthase complex subunit delta